MKVDARNEKLGYRMRDAQVHKVPLVLVLGDAEANNHSVNVRRHGAQNTQSMDVDAFKDAVVREIKTKGGKISD